MKFSFFIICMFSIFSLTAKEIIVAEKLIEGFEHTISPAKNRLKSQSLKPSIFQNWGTRSLTSIYSSDKYVTQGGKSVKMTIHKGAKGWPMFKIVFKKPQDWSNYNAIAVDIANQLGDTNYLRAAFCDSNNNRASFEIHMTANSEHTAVGYFNRLTNKKVDFKKITAFYLFLHGSTVQRDYYIDNIRLQKNKFIKIPRQSPPADAIAFQGGTKTSIAPTALISISPDTLFGKNWELKPEGKVIGAKSQIADYTNAMGTVIYSSKPATMTIKNLKNGQYFVYIGAGNIAKNKTFDFIVSCGSKNIRLTPTTRFQGDSAIIAVEVQNGTLPIKLIPCAKANWAIGSLVIYPAKNRITTECTYISLLEKDFYMGADAEVERKTLTKNKKLSVKNTFIPSNQEKQQGFVIFSSNINKTIYYYGLPEQSETLGKLKSLQSIITQNESSQVTVSIHALKNLGLVSAELSEFKNANGDIINSEYLKLGAIKPYYLSQGSFYKKMPYYISLCAQSIVHKGQNQRFWLTVHNNNKLASGIYKGNIVVTVTNKKYKIPVELNLKQIELKIDPRVNYGVFVYQPSSSIMRKQSHKWKRILKNMRDHGLTSMAPCNIIGCKKVNDSFELTSLAYFNLFMEMYKEAGFTGPVINYSPNTVYNMANKWLKKFKRPVIHTSAKDYWLKKPPPDFFKAIGEWNKKFQDYCKEKEYPLVVNMLLDEHPSENTVTKVYTALKEAGAITVSTSVGRYGINWNTTSPIDINIYLSGLKNNWTKMATELHENSKQMWFNDPMATPSKELHKYRYITGYWSWLYAADGFIPWNYSRTNLRATSGIESIPNGDSWFSFYTPEGPINAMCFEMYRTGIYDRRAIYTLELLIKQEFKSSNKTKQKLAVSGKHLLEELKTELGELRTDSDWKNWMIKYAKKYREKMINLIIKLQSK